MPQHSAGVLMFRRSSGALEVLLVHPGGPYWAAKDAGAWTIPKGLIEPGEDALAAARREFEEETGAAIGGEFLPLQPVRGRSGKVIHAWAVSGDFDPARLRSNTFSMEWPPRSGQAREFPEADRAAWFGVEEARAKILPGQAPLLDQLVAKLADGAAGG